MAPPLAAQPTAGNVNDCTLIRDPIALRDCILRYGNVRTQPPGTVETTAPAAVAPAEPAADPSGEIVEVPTAPTNRKAGPAKRSAKAVTPRRPVAALPPQPPAAPLPQPNPNDTITHIEQIEQTDMPRARR